MTRRRRTLWRLNARLYCQSDTSRAEGVTPGERKAAAKMLTALVRR
jgi:hypothetical protein